MERKILFALFAASVMVLSSFILLAQNDSSNPIGYLPQSSPTSYSYSQDPLISVGSGPNAIVSYHGYIYAANLKSNTVSVIYGGTVVDTLSTEIDEPNGLAVATSGSDSVLLISNYGSDTVSAYVISGYDAFSGRTASASAPLYTEFVAVGDSPGGLSYDSSNGEVYVADSSTHNVSYFPLQNFLAVSPQIPSSLVAVADGPEWTTYDPSDGYVYTICENNNGNTVYIISSSNVVKTISSLPQMVLAYDSYYSAVIGVSTSGVYEFTGTTDILNTFPVGGNPWAVAPGPAGLVYVANQLGDMVNVLSLSANVTTVSISGSSPQGIVYSATDQSIFVSDFDSSGVIPVSVISYYTVTFTESGLPAGTEWSVTLNGQVESSTSASIQFTGIQGGKTYSYTVSPLSGYDDSPSSGSITVNGALEPQDITFSELYSVTFSESGLPAGTEWYVAMDNQNISGSSSSITVSSVVQGSYSYSVYTPFDYMSSPISGSVDVPRQLSVSLSFSQDKYNVNFDETGLPSGTTWSVTFNGDTEARSTSQIEFNATNGNYEYTVSPPSGYAATPASGYISIDGGPVTLSVTMSNAFTFTLQLFPSDLTMDQGSSASLQAYVNFTFPNGDIVTLSASGLPSNMTTAFSVPTGPNNFVSSLTISTGSYVSPGSYSLEILAKGGGITKSATLGIQVNPANTLTYTAEFVETGLPHGQIWYVNIGDKTISSSAGTISFSLTDGTYDFNTSSYGYSAVPGNGSIDIQDSSINKDIAFTEITTNVGILSGSFFNDLTFNASKWQPSITGWSYYPIAVQYSSLASDGFLAIKPGAGLQILQKPLFSHTSGNMISALSSKTGFTAPFSISAEFIYYPGSSGIPFYLSVSNGTGDLAKFYVTSSGGVNVWNGASSVSLGQPISPDEEYNISVYAGTGFIEYVLSSPVGSLTYYSYYLGKDLELGVFNVSMGTQYNYPFSQSGEGSGMVSSTIIKVSMSSYQPHDLTTSITESPGGFNPSTWAWGQAISETATDQATGITYNINGTSKNLAINDLPSGEYSVVVSTALQALGSSANVSVQREFSVMVGNPEMPFSSAVSVIVALSAPPLAPMNISISSLTPTEIMAYDNVTFEADATGSTGSYEFTWDVYTGTMKSVASTSGNQNQTFEFQDPGQYYVDVSATPEGSWLGNTVQQKSSSSPYIGVDVLPAAYYLGLTPKSGSNVSLSFNSIANEVLAYGTNEGFTISGALEDTSSLAATFPQWAQATFGISNAWQGISASTPEKQVQSTYFVQPGRSISFSNLSIPMGTLPETREQFNVTLDPWNTYAIMADAISAGISALGVAFAAISNGLSGSGLTALQQLQIGLIMDLSTLLLNDLFKAATGGLSSLLSGVITLLENAGSLARNLVKTVLQHSLDNILSGLAESIGIDITERLTDLFSIFLTWIPVGVFAANIIEIASTLYQGSFSSEFEVNCVTRASAVKVSSSIGGAPYIISDAGSSTYGYSGAWQDSNGLLVHSPYTNTGYSMEFPDPQTVTYKVEAPPGVKESHYSIEFQLGSETKNVTGNVTQGSPVTYVESVDNGTMSIQIIEPQHSPPLLDYIILGAFLAVIASAGIVAWRRKK